MAIRLISNNRWILSADCLDESTRLPVGLHCSLLRLLSTVVYLNSCFAFDGKVTNISFLVGEIDDGGAVNFGSNAGTES